MKNQAGIPQGGSFGNTFHGNFNRDSNSSPPPNQINDLCRFGHTVTLSILILLYLLLNYLTLNKLITIEQFYSEELLVIAITTSYEMIVNSLK